jgi:hypothetical protein
MVKKKASIGISLPEVMLHQVRIRARDNCRSISREIEYLLQAAMGAELDQQLETLRAMNRIENLVKSARPSPLP